MGSERFFPLIERLPAEEIAAFQNLKLREALSYLQDHSPFYRNLWKESRIDSSRILTVEDLRQLPVTTKEDLQGKNEEFVCVPKDKIIDYITTSGTMGEPVTFAMTDRDLDRLAYNEAISFSCAGASPENTLSKKHAIIKQMKPLFLFMTTSLVGLMFTASTTISLNLGTSRRPPAA